MSYIYKQILSYHYKLFLSGNYKLFLSNAKTGSGKLEDFSDRLPFLSDRCPSRTKDSNPIRLQRPKFHFWFAM
jgi:hypothetical protein